MDEYLHETNRNLNLDILGWGMFKQWFMDMIRQQHLINNN